MPPRIPIVQVTRSCQAPLRLRASATLSPLASLFAALSVQARDAHILATLRDNRGAYSKRIRVGRGPSSGKGKTSGRGQKGTKARSKVNPWFQGGQTPLAISKGRKGFENLRALDLHTVNLERIQSWIDHGRLDPSKLITPRELISSGCVGHQLRDGIKLLLSGFRPRGKSAATASSSTSIPNPLRIPINICVSRASASAIAAIEAAGGSIVTRYYTKQAIRRLMRGESVHTVEPLPVGKERVAEVLARSRTSDGKYLYRLPDPTSREDMEYYRDPAHRGYLSHLLKAGESPSLFFKVPTEQKVLVQRARKEGEEEKKEDMKLFKL